MTTRPQLRLEADAERAMFKSKCPVGKYER
jgi:hypothetical protein